MLNSARSHFVVFKKLNCILQSHRILFGNDNKNFHNCLLQIDVFQAFNFSEQKFQFDNT